ARSSFATSSNTPSSTPRRPSCHASATRMAYCSIVSGSVVGTSRIAIWLPLRSSNSRRRASSAAISPAVSVCVRSVTGARSGGTATCANAQTHRSSDSELPSDQTLNRDTRNPCARVSSGGFGGRRLSRRLAEIDRWRLRDLRLVLDAEVLLLCVPEDLRGEIRRERSHRHVVVLHRVDVALARDRNAILGAFQLGAQVVEAGNRFQIRIALDD